MVNCGTSTNVQYSTVLLYCTVLVRLSSSCRPFIPLFNVTKKEDGGVSRTGRFAIKYCMVLGTKRNIRRTVRRSARPESYRYTYSCVPWDFRVRSTYLRTIRACVGTFGYVPAHDTCLRWDFRVRACVGTLGFGFWVLGLVLGFGFWFLVLGLGFKFPAFELSAFKLPAFKFPEFQYFNIDFLRSFSIASRLVTVRTAVVSPSVAFG